MGDARLERFFFTPGAAQVEMGLESEDWAPAGNGDLFASPGGQARNRLGRNALLDKARTFK